MATTYQSIHFANNSFRGAFGSASILINSELRGVACCRPAGHTPELVSDELIDWVDECPIPSNLMVWTAYVDGKFLGVAMQQETLHEAIYGFLKIEDVNAPF